MACILTSFALDSNPNTVVDHRIHVLAIDFLSYILFLQSLLPRSVSFTICSSISEVSSRRRSLHYVLPTQNKLLERAVALPESHSLLSSALCRCCYWFSMLVLLSFASVTLLVHANHLEVPVYAFSIVEATILGTDYCRLLHLVRVLGAGISSTRQYLCSMFLIMAARSRGHIGGYRRLDDTCPHSFPCIFCS